MKGQNLAIESVAAFGLTILAAIGMIQVFSGLEGDFTSTAESSFSDTVSNKLRINTLQLSTLDKKDSAEVDLQIEEEIGGGEYQIAFNDSNIEVFNPGFSYSQGIDIGGGRYDLKGAVDGGNIKIYKIDNTIEVSQQ